MPLWLMILTLVAPDGSPRLLAIPVPSEALCMARAELIRSTRPTAPYAVLCVNLGKLVGVEA